MRSLLEQLAEATYARDAGVRAQAQRFADDLIKYLDEDEDTLEGRLRARADGGYEVNATKFTRALARPLNVVLLPKERGLAALERKEPKGEG